MSIPIHWDLGVCMLSVYDADGFLGIQYDAEGEQNSGVHDYEAYPTNGCYHRPLDPQVDANGVPVSGQAATVLFAMEAGRGHVIPLGDPRVIADLLPQLQKGETVVFSDYGNFLRLKADGSTAIYTTTTGGGPDGTAIIQWWTPSNRSYQAPWGTELWDATGYFLAHSCGAGITLGYAGGLVPGYGSYCRLTADMIDFDAAVISIGPTGVPKTPVVQAPKRATAVDAPLAAALTALSTAVTALQASLVATPGNNGASAPAVGAAISALSTAISALGASLVSTASQTVIG